MASLHRRLHGLFSSSHPPTRKPKPKPNISVKSSNPTPPSKPTGHIRSSVRALFKEPELESLVRKFKEYSETNWFRSRHAIYSYTVRRLASHQHFSAVEEILEAQKKYPNITTEGFAVRLISLYGKAGMFDHALKLFDEMPQLNCERTAKSFNALLAACVNSNKLDRVEEIFRELPSKLSINRDVVSYNTVIKAFCEMGSWDSALSLVDEMERNGMEPNSITFNTLLDAFYRAGRFSDGENIWVVMENKGIVPCIRSYNSKLRGLVLDKRMSDAVQLVEELGSKGLKANVFSFNALIKGFCDYGNVEESKRWYGELLKSDVAPDRMTYAVLVPLTREMGHFEMAFELCNDAIRRKCVVDGMLLQSVVDGLVRQSKLEEAKMLVELGRSASDRYKDLKLHSN